MASHRRAATPNNLVLSLRRMTRRSAAGLSVLVMALAFAATATLHASTAGAVAPTGPLTCDGSVVYAQDSSGAVYPFDVSSHTLGSAVLDGQ